MPGPVTLRPIEPGDEPFLREVYYSTRYDELRVVNWSMAEREMFLRMQFDAQHAYYQQHYPDASFSIILEQGQPAGRLYLHRGPSEYRIIDIALLPAFQGKGIGTGLLAGILIEAASQAKPVTIHVERFNPAQRLYLRLGFQVLEEGPVYLLLQKNP